MAKRKSTDIEPSVFPSDWKLPTKSYRPTVHADHTVDTVLAPEVRFSFAVQANEHRRYQDEQRMAHPKARYVLVLTDGTRQDFASVAAACKAFVAAGASAARILLVSWAKNNAKNPTEEVIA